MPLGKASTGDFTGKVRSGWTAWDDHIVPSGVATVRRSNPVVAGDLAFLPNLAPHSAS